MGFAQFVILATAGLQWWVGLKLIQAGRLTFTELLAVILTIMFGAVGLGQFAADASDKAEALVAARNISKLWAQQAVIQVERPELKGPAVVGDIELRDVSFSYPARPDRAVYSGLNLCIEAGTTVALVGPSGCGKSSLVGLVERFYDVTGGSVLLDGRDIRELNVHWLRSLIGYVGQEP
ncbi:P-loop containing nucleoside triphosphate hydrolase protein, partial [Ochromonadaceae sp. CCMP2298]